MKDKWGQCLVSDLISSEDSDENDSIVVKPLPWRAPKGTDFFKKLDVLIDEDKTSQAKRQRKDRIISSVESSRQKPSGGVPKWACISDPSQ